MLYLNENICFECEPGFYLEKNICVPIKINLCYKGSKNKCLACRNGILVENNNCKSKKKCSIKNCDVCSNENKT